MPSVDRDLIHSVVPQRDVLSDKMVLCMVTHPLPVFFVKYCHKLCIQRQMAVQ